MVDNAEGLSLSINPDKEIYLPGETAGVDISVSGSDGSGTQAALGVAIVDESDIILKVIL